MWGKIDSQINLLFNKTVNNIGESRHKEKEYYRSIGVKTHSEMAKNTGINSYGTSNTYIPIWRELANHANDKKNLKDIEKISNRTVKNYLQKKMNEVSKYSSFTKICSAVSKFETSLNKYAEESGSGNKYDFSKVVDNMRSHASGKLDSSIEGRGFEDRHSVAEKIERDDHRLVAEIQCESGCRVHEASLIKEEQLQGIGVDPYNSQEKGVVNIEGKGGKEREIYLEPKTYEKLQNYIKESKDNLFRVDKREYTKDVKTTANEIGERYTGTHDFRHAWVQERFQELESLGYSYEQSLAACSYDIGHTRPDITLTYLK